MTDVAPLTADVVRRTIQLAEVPAPTGSEHDRAAIVRSWWERDGLADVHLDGTGNVWGRIRDGDGDGDRGIVIVCAHLDTVFGTEVPHTVRVERGRLIGPSVGDDSVGVAALSAAGRSLSDGRLPVWVLATVGEEGLGNLRGAIAALDAPPADVGAFVAVEGNYLGRVSAVAVGSLRRRVRLTGPGGHAWEERDVPSAVHEAARLVGRIAAIPPRAGTAVNVGRIGGGEGINVRAREAWFEIDVRAEDPGELDALVRQIDDVLAGIGSPLAVEQQELGSRPAGRTGSEHPLVTAACDALGEANAAVARPATSTDANAAHARGVPAIAVGITRGAGEHTATEWIETGPIETGIRALARTVERFEELTG